MNFISKFWAIWTTYLGYLKGTQGQVWGILGVWQYGLWSFQTGGTKLERFQPKNQHTQRKLSNFENWINGGL